MMIPVEFKSWRCRFYVNVMLFVYSLISVLDGPAAPPSRLLSYLSRYQSGDNAAKTNFLLICCVSFQQQTFITKKRILLRAFWCTRQAGMVSPTLLLKANDVFSEGS